MDCNLNPDPSGGFWTGKPVTDEYWYPLYEKMVELDVLVMIPCPRLAPIAALDRREPLA